ncbi:ROK family transcriptional regulator [Vallitalea pronyensis]|uniref:ROK family transcriptional regulator n=1 Tax=Vallitalea pronyensis TaxID=1348613 RepID=A0A8J8SG71_9FIRM|nr:ROK family transcriptional regulator [Vallitalea pronyensis]QUI22450.1 ROK family transcriptional regulator [Vallitalea pronyensis]
MKRRTTADKKLIKKINTNAILNVIKQKGPISRADIAKILALNPATISSNVNDLLQTRLIEEIGIGDSSGGRRPILLRVNSKENYIIGVHTELTHVNVGMINMDGDMQVKHVYPYPKAGRELTEKDMMTIIISGIKDILFKSNVDSDKIIGIGLGMHGLVNSEKGESIFAPAFNWHHISIKQILSETFDTDIIVDNDVRVMAIGEKWFGKAKKSDNFILINLSEGIGGALVINGKLYSGNTFGAGEIGHIQVTRQPYACKCGNTGCLTTVASEEGVVDRLKELISTKDYGVFHIERLDDLTIDKIYDAAFQKNPVVVKLLTETGGYIGRSIGSLINILNPEKVILTGPMLKVKAFLMDAIKASAASTSISDNYVETKITVSSIEEDLGVIGAATLIINNLFMGIDT